MAYHILLQGKPWGNKYLLHHINKYQRQGSYIGGLIYAQRPPFNVGKGLISTIRHILEYVILTNIKL